MLQFKFLILVSAISLVSVFAFGPFVGMKMNSNGEMDGCPFSMSAICPMGLFEHIGNWQSLFMVTIQKMITLLSFIAFALILLTRYRNSHKPPDIATQTHSLYWYHNPEIRIFNYLKEMFSQGILNPRIYA